MLDKSVIEAILKDLHKDEDVGLIEYVEKSAKIVGENWDSNLVKSYSDVEANKIYELITFRPRVRIRSFGVSSNLRQVIIFQFKSSNWDPQKGGGRY